MCATTFGPCGRRVDDLGQARSLSLPRQRGDEYRWHKLWRNEIVRRREVSQIIVRTPPQRSIRIGEHAAGIHAFVGKPSIDPIASTSLLRPAQRPRHRCQDHLHATTSPAGPRSEHRSWARDSAFGAVLPDGEASPSPGRTNAIPGNWKFAYRHPRLEAPPVTSIHCRPGHRRRQFPSCPARVSHHESAVVQAHSARVCCSYWTDRTFLEGRVPNGWFCHSAQDPCGSDVLTILRPARLRRPQFEPERILPSGGLSQNAPVPYRSAPTT